MKSRSFNHCFLTKKSRITALNLQECRKITGKRKIAAHFIDKSLSMLYYFKWVKKYEKYFLSMHKMVKFSCVIDVYKIMQWTGDEQKKKVKIKNIFSRRLFGQKKTLIYRTSESEAEKDQFKHKIFCKVVLKWKIRQRISAEGKAKGYSAMCVWCQAL